MKKISRLVIADDLTGANDTGVHFLCDTKTVEVIIDAEKQDEVPLQRKIDTLVINTNTRNVSAEESSRKLSSCVEGYLTYSPKEIYKKIDSTLRGNIGAEIDALMTTSAYKIACVAPAVPRNGRTTVNGICYVNGIALDKTEFANDPFSPVESSNIREIIAKQTTRVIGILTLDILRDQLCYALKKTLTMISEGVEIFIVDSKTKEDLMKAKTLFSALEMKVLYVGAAGFFHAISSFERGNTQLQRPKVKRALIVIGSMMETSKQQIEWLLERGLLTKTFSVISANVIKEEKEETNRLANKISEEYTLSPIVLLHTDRDISEVTANAQKVGDVLSKVTQMIMIKENIDALIVIGGETALNILKRMGISSLRLVDEILPAVPVAHMSVPCDGDHVIFISKAGSYGDKDVLEGIIHYLNKINELHTGGYR